MNSVKALFTLFSFFIVFISAQAQKPAYHPLLGENTRWYVQGYNTTTAKTYIHKLIGDTVIENKVYSMYADPMLSDSTALAYLREDTFQRKVWVYNLNTLQEELLYDFWLDLGDSLDLNFTDKGGGSPASGSYKVTSVDSVQTLQGCRRAIRLTNSGYNLTDPRSGTNTLYWIEGVGSTVGPAYTQYAYTVLDVDYTRFRTLCVFQDTMHVYALIHKDTCTQNIGGVGFADVKTPNNFTAKVQASNNQNILSLNLENKTNLCVNIYDLQGRQLNSIYKNNLPAGKHNFNLGIDKRGMYLINVEAVTNNGAQREVIKFVKQ